jgi:hypothetical protein|nr:MAG TPA: hypothetical protein [Bacteriophage sp.]
MSEKGLLFKKRKNNHGQHPKCSRGSQFPRHSMNYYPGTYLGMRLRYSKPSIGRLYREYNYNRGYLRTNRIIGFINKFIGKPYNDLVKAFYILIKDLRAEHKDVGLADLEWYFGKLRYRRRKGDYYIDDDGLVQKIHPESTRKQTSNINKQQIAYNKSVKIPDFGRVSIPRKVNSKEPVWKYGFSERDYIHYPFTMFQILILLLNIGLILMEFVNLRRENIVIILILENGTIAIIVIVLVICSDQVLMNVNEHNVLKIVG